MNGKLLGCCFFLYCCQLQAQIDFSLKLEKSGNYCITTNNKITIQQTIDGKVTQTINTEKGAYCYKILEDLDSVYLVETVFTHLSQRVENQDTISYFNSDSLSENNVMSTFLSKLINKPFLVWLRKDYSWVKTEGLDSIFLNIYKDFELPAATKSYLDSIMLEMVKTFSRNDADLTAVLYNSKNIIPGSVWTTSTYAEHVVPALDSTTYYLAETGGDLFDVTGTGIIISSPEGTNDGNETTWYDLEGSSKIFVSVYKNSFWLNRGNIVIELNGIAYIKNNKTKATLKVPTKIMTEASVEGYKL